MTELRQQRKEFETWALDAANRLRKIESLRDTEVALEWAWEAWRARPSSLNYGTLTCGKNMGNDLLVIPCDLPKGHQQPCERNIWPVTEAGRASLETADRDNFYALLRRICEDVIDWRITMAEVHPDLYDHPNYKELGLKLARMYEHPLDNKVLAQTDRIEAAESENERLREALIVLAEALKEPDGGSYWPARQYLDKYDKYHEDLDGTRVLWQVACLAIRGGTNV